MTKNSWLTPELLQDADKYGQKIELTKENVFMHEYAETLHSYILLEGRVRILAKSDPYLDDGHADIILNDLNAVDVLGEISAIDNMPHSSIVETLSPCLLYKFTAPAFKSLIDAHAPLRNFVMLRLCEKIRNANERLRDNCVLNSNLRVTREIIRLAEAHASPISGNADRQIAKIDDFPKHHVLASRCGVTRETVSRVLTRLTKDNILIRDGNAVIIEDLDLLGQALSSAER